MEPFIEEFPSKALDAQRVSIMNDNATFTKAEVFTFSDEELGIEAA